MTPQFHRQRRMNVILQMVMALVVAILLAQLWLFTIALDAMETASVSATVGIAAAICSFLACGAVWLLIRFFVNTEQAETGERS